MHAKAWATPGGRREARAHVRPWFSVYAGRIWVALNSSVVKKIKRAKSVYLPLAILIEHFFTATVCVRLFLSFPLHFYWLPDRTPLGTPYREAMNLYYRSFMDPE